MHANDPASRLHKSRMEQTVWLFMTLAFVTNASSSRAENVAPPETKVPTAITISPLSWEDGIRFEARSKWLNFRVGGKVQGDVGWADGKGEPDMGGLSQDRSEWRRLRPFVSGTVADRLDFKLEGEFTGSQAKWMDLYLRLKDIPGVGKVTVGHFKEPFGLEQLTSSADTTFLERALPDIFAPGRSVGAMLSDSVFGRRATWSVGLFHSLADKDTFPDGAGGEARAVTGRATWLPSYEEKTGGLVHVGAAYSYRSIADQAKYRQRPEAHLLNYVTDTGKMDAASSHLLGVEAAWVNGPLSLSGEYMASCLERETQGTTFFHGFYTQASYFVTGEHRPYDRDSGIFKGPVPAKVFPSRGLGAWEVSARYSFLDLQASQLPSSATQVQDLTLGVNWYINPNLRLSWNYVRSWIGTPDSSGGDIVVFRIQLAF